MFLGSFCYCFRPRPRQCVVNIDDDDATGRFEYFHFSFFSCHFCGRKTTAKKYTQKFEVPDSRSIDTSEDQHTGSFVKQSRKPNLNGFIAGNPAEPESTREKKKELHHFFLQILWVSKVAQILSSCRSRADFFFCFLLLPTCLFFGLPPCDVTHPGIPQRPTLVFFLVCLSLSKKQPTEAIVFFLSFWETP